MLPLASSKLLNIRFFFTQYYSSVYSLVYNSVFTPYVIPCSRVIYTVLHFSAEGVLSIGPPIGYIHLFQKNLEDTYRKVPLPSKSNYFQVPKM